MNYLEGILEWLRFKNFSDCGTYFDIKNNILHVRFIDETSLIEIKMLVKDATILEIRQLELSKITPGSFNITEHFLPLSNYLNTMTNGKDVQ